MMRLLYAYAVIFFSVFVCNCAIVNQLQRLGRISAAEHDELRRKIEAAGGCNANICFAIDGSGSISSEAFQNEKNFVLDVASVVGVDEPVELAAVQFSTANTPISPLTPDTSEFILSVESAAQLKGASFVTAGISYCFSQLWRRQGEANKIVVLGDGRSNIGSSAVRRADLFRQVGGEVSVVAAGFSNDQELLGIAGGQEDHVFRVSSFLDVLTLKSFVEALVEQVCV